MKQYALTILFILSLSTSFGQIKKIGQLSNGHPIGSSIVYEEGRSDVYGYFLLFQFNQQSNRVYDLEYVLLDKNLNKVTSGTFSSVTYKKFLGETTIKLNSVSKYGHKLLLSFYNMAEDNRVLTAFGYSGKTRITNLNYRVLNLNDFSLSNSFIIVDNQRVDKKIEEGDKKTIGEANEQQILQPADNKGVLLQPINTKQWEYSSYVPGYKRRAFSKAHHLLFLDSEMDKLWTYPINNDENDLGAFYPAASDSTVLIIKKEHLSKKAKISESFKTLDIHSGKFLHEFENKDSNYKMSNYQVYIVGNHIIFYNYLFDKNKKNPKYSKNKGYARIVIDKETGKEISRKFMVWKDLTAHLDINPKNGKIKKHGLLFFENFTPLEDGSTIAVAEGYKEGKSAKIYNMFVIKFDANMNIIYFNKIKKHGS